jgi:hypothetical protein
VGEKTSHPETLTSWLGRVSADPSGRQINGFDRIISRDVAFPG